MNNKSQTWAAEVLWSYYAYFLDQLELREAKKADWGNARKSGELEYQAMQMSLNVFLIMMEQIKK